MGVENLLRLVSLKTVKLKNIEYDNIIIDASCWLHRVKYANECELAICDESVAYIRLVSEMILPFDKSKIIFCFDGKTPEIKAVTHFKRRVNHEAIRKRAELILKSSKDPVKIREAKKQLITTVQVSFLVNGLKKYLDSNCIRYCTAEYEADSLIAGICGDNDLVITEDSDLIARGVKNILFKYNHYNRSGKLFEFDTSFIKINSDIIKIKDFNLLTEFCVISGCDYFKIKGISSMRAAKICKNEETLKQFLSELDEITLIGYTKALACFKRNDKDEMMSVSSAELTFRENKAEKIDDQEVNLDLNSDIYII
jgi:5'-3' exonuclease